jgi:hypothetical protein
MRTLVSDYGITNSTSSFKQTLMALFFRCLSKHAQHVFFISSLVGQFNHYAKRRQMVMSKLNAAMRLTYRDGATQLPMAMRGGIWGNTNLDQILTENALMQSRNVNDLRVLARKVIDVSPRWSRYAPVDEMADDLVILLREQCVQMGHPLPEIVCA